MRPGGASISVIAVLALALGFPARSAAPPPEELDFQGFLRDAAGQPVNGDRAVNVRFFDAESGGVEILIDAHDSIPVVDGAFRVPVGKGVLSDGSGPGTYTTLADVFADHPRAWMEIEIGDPVTRFIFSKLAPRTKTSVSPVSLKAMLIGGKSSDALLDVSAAPQVKDGDLTVDGTLAAEEIAGDGAQLTGVDAVSLDGMPAAAFSPAVHGHDGAEIAGAVAHADVAEVAGIVPRAAAACAHLFNRLVDCGNGTVSDTVTGLLWLKDMNCAALGGPQDFASANQAAAGLGHGTCGLSDHSAPGEWRLPTVAEWQAFTAQAVANGCVGGVAPFVPNVLGTGCCSTGACPFANVFFPEFWTSTTSGDGSSAWVADTNDSLFLSIPKFVPTLYAWPVRSPR